MSSMMLYLVKIANFPKEDEELLMVLHFFARIRQVGLNKGVLQESSEAVQHKSKVLLAVDAREIVDKQILVDHAALLQFKSSYQIQS